MLPSTANRVNRSTEDAVNERIRRQIDDNVRHYSRTRADINRRLRELDREWDVERVLEANAAGVIMAGAALGATVDRRWLYLPVAAAGFLLLHAFQGWCPPLPVIRRLGVRTAREIEVERTALKALRGDFEEPGEPCPGGVDEVCTALQAAAR